MKKYLLILLAVLICLPSMGQKADRPHLYDYDANKHEIAIDIVPILGGNLPSSFFYRKNYISSTGSMRGLRLSVVAGNDYNAINRTYENLVFTREAILNYQLSVGTEWQKPVLHNFIAYSGVDIGGGYNSQRFYGVNTGQSVGGIKSFTYQHIDVNVTGFWGVKYHIMTRLSIFAEMGIVANFSDNASLIKRNYFDSRHDRIDSFNNFSLNLLPLRALRVAYHF